MEDQIEEVVEIVEMLLENPLPNKVSQKLWDIHSNLKSSSCSSDTLIKIQDELEVLGAMSNIDDFTRNELINLVTYIEMIYNS